MPNGSPDPRTGNPSAQDAGVIPANVEHFEVMQVRLRFKAWMKSSLGACRTLRDLASGGSASVVRNP
jgi:hypothetical protein